MGNVQLKKSQSGFTLIELVVVIVILGILAATAIPRFTGMSREARIASVQGMLAAVRSAATIAHSQALVQGVTDGDLPMEGLNVTLVNGYPATADGGINAALSAADGFGFAAGVFSMTGAPTPATCSVTYTQPAAAGGAPTITSNVNGC